VGGLNTRRDARDVEVMRVVWVVFNLEVVVYLMKCDVARGIEVGLKSFYAFARYGIKSRGAEGIYEKRWACPFVVHSIFGRWVFKMID
jgi:hypothetical protein